MTLFNILTFKVNSIFDLCSIAYRASYLEVSSEPKPGNVSPHQSVGKTHYEDFLQSIQAIQDLNLHFFTQKPNINSLGDYIFEAVQKMMNVQNAGNVLLGHILLFTPLLFGAHKIIFEKKPYSWYEFWNLVDQIIHESTTNDAIMFYRAVRQANPGGLINPGGIKFQPKFDFTLPETENKILQDKPTLRDLFYESAEFDLISQEYLENYRFCQIFFLNWALPHYNKYTNSNDFVCDLFLQILASHYDSLIYRKNTLEFANEITQQAKMIVNHGGIRTEEGRHMIQELNAYLIQGHGKLNPGTSADLTACILFIGMLFGVFQKAD